MLPNLFASIRYLLGQLMNPEEVLNGQAISLEYFMGIG